MIEPQFIFEDTRVLDPRLGDRPRGHISTWPYETRHRVIELARRSSVRFRASGICSALSKQATVREIVNSSIADLPIKKDAWEVKEVISRIFNLFYVKHLDEYYLPRTFLNWMTRADAKFVGPEAVANAMLRIGMKDIELVWDAAGTVTVKGTARSDWKWLSPKLTSDQPLCWKKYANSAGIPVEPNSTL